MSAEMMQTTTFAMEHPFRILLVEDHPINQRLAYTILKKLGYEIDIAGNGIEALKATELKSYDLIYMDLQMPEMGGLEATRHILAKYTEQDAPLIIATVSYTHLTLPTTPYV